MAWLPKFVTKALSESEMRHPRRPLIWFDWQKPGDDKMRKDIGDATAMNIVLTPIRWIQRSFHEADLVIDTEGVLDSEHKLVQLINKPNPFYSGEHLFSATLLSLAVDGNAYWLVVRNTRGRVIQFWYVPHTLIEPKFPDKGNDFITHYEQSIGKQIRIVTKADGKKRRYTGVLESFNGKCVRMSLKDTAETVEWSIEHILEAQLNPNNA